MNVHAKAKQRNAICRASKNTEDERMKTVQQGRIESEQSGRHEPIDTGDRRCSRGRSDSTSMRTMMRDRKRKGRSRIKKRRRARRRRKTTTDMMSSARSTEVR